MPKTYSEKLLDPRWQKRRLELLEAAGWTCRECGTKTQTLHVHHGHYKRAADPWNYPDDVMHILCEECHGEMQGYMAQTHESIGRFSKSELLALSEFLYTVEGGPISKFKLFTLLDNIVSAALSEGTLIPDDQAGFAWMLTSTLSASRDKAIQVGYEYGLKEAKGEHATAIP